MKAHTGILWNQPKPSSQVEAKTLPSEDELFDKENPGVYAAFVAEARRVLAEGFRHYSARTIVHDLRHRTGVHDGSGMWKLNNAISPYLARRLMRDRPEFSGWFELRERKSA